MKEIYSKIKPEELLAVIKRKVEISPGRQDLTKASEPLQAGVCHVEEGMVAKPHYHKEQNRSINKTQESIVIVQGQIESEIYDLDNKTVLEKVTLNQGDCFIAIACGHSHKATQKETIIYEFKNGPYNGPEKDKESI